MTDITVIIPTYNSETYLAECIESVRRQDMDGLEILIIDAHSTDQTGAIARLAAQEDTRIRMVYSDEKSYGYQLNKGMEEAQGEYIAVVESDDYILPGMLPELYSIARECDADYVKGDFESFLEAANGSQFVSRECFSQELRHIYNRVIRPLDYPEIYVEDIYLWKGIYKAAFLKNKQIRFHETPGAAYQDVGFLYQVFTCAQRAVYVDKCFYRYRRNNLNSSTYNRKAFRYLEGEYVYLENKIAEEGMNPILEGYYYERMFRQCVSRFRLMGASGQYWEDAEEDILRLRGKLQEAYQGARLDAGIFGAQLWLEFLMFMQDVQGYAAYNIQLIHTKLDAWRDMKKELDRYQEIVLVSASPLNKFLFTLLDDDKASRVQAICDKDASKWGSTIMGKKVYSYEKASAMYPHAAYIVANYHYKPEMKRQLIQLGIDDADIFVCSFEMDWLMATG